MTRSRGILSPRRRWTADELETIRINYANWPTFLIAHLVNREDHAVYQQAAKMGLKKSAKYLASAWAHRLSGKHPNSIASRFKPGIVPANKGLRRPGYCRGRMAETQFKAGQRGCKWLPIGSERINADGYRDRKVADTGYPPRDWVGVHRLLWIEHHGPIPAAHGIVFRDGDKTHIAIENLELVTRRELMRRNTIHNLPPPLVEVIQLKSAISRRITCAKRKRA